MSLERGAALVRKWAPRFGLGEFRLTVRELDMDNAEGWALSHFDVDEMWGLVELPGDGEVEDALQELLVLHELAHGLLMLARYGKVNEEQACNRIARLARGDFLTPLANEQHLQDVGDAEFFLKKKRNAADIDRRAWLPIVADALPAKERAVIAALYYEGQSLREVGRELGVDVHTVSRWRDTALERLGRYFAALEELPANEGVTFASRKLIALKEPEGGAEHELVYLLHHRCPQANALVHELKDEDMDLLVFPVGNVGYGMPKGIPFEVTSLTECGGCGRTLTTWFVWQAGVAAPHAGELWTP